MKIVIHHTTTRKQTKKSGNISWALLCNALPIHWHIYAALGVDEFKTDFTIYLPSSDEYFASLLNQN